MMPRALLCLPLLLTTVLASAPSQSTTEEVEPAELGSTVNVHRCGNLWFAGQFSPEDISALEEHGIHRVITLRKEGEVTWDEEAKVEEAGLEFHELPFATPDELSDVLIDELRALLRQDSVPTLFHCGSANRVGGAWIPYRVLDQGVPLEQALEEANAIGLRTPGYKERALEYIARETGPEESVNEGINAPFKDPELDVGSFVDRFEVESREVYSARDAIVAAIGLQPGMRVADVGAGTGLYTFLFTDAVGADGWVYAIDIAAPFLERIRGLAVERGVRNVTGVLCLEDSIGLPPASIDVAYVCDTYHHFEYPRTTLVSIYRALKPGGRLIVIDFERIEGVSREWTLDHVRAGKEVFRLEIENAGFRNAREVDVEGLEENYFLEFQKPAEPSAGAEAQPR